MEYFLALCLIIMGYFLYKDSREIKKLSAHNEYLEKTSSEISATLDRWARDYNKLTTEQIATQNKLYDKQSENAALKLQIEQQKTAHKEQTIIERKDAINKSRTVIKGQISENMIPLLPDFPFQTGDCKFLGMPIDYIVFQGMSENNVTEIIILDVKTGSAQLNKVQRQIRDVIKAGKVSWRTLRPNLEIPEKSEEKELTSSEESVTVKA